eukprot:579941-Amphidinium_carterae.1
MLREQAFDRTADPCLEGRVGRLMHYLEVPRAKSVKYSFKKTLLTFLGLFKTCFGDFCEIWGFGESTAPVPSGTGCHAMITKGSIA